VHPPQDVIEAFRDVASAREDKIRITNEAEAYRNEILPRARGQAAEMINQAQAYRAARIRAAEGEAGRFKAVLAEYEKARDVTRKRLYYEALEEILSSADLEKIILPPGATDRTLPLLPLDVLGKPAARQPQSRGGQ
jgi:membrane protease subunit HflK